MKIRNLKFVFWLGIGVFAGAIVSCSGNNEVNNVETNDSVNHVLTKEAKIAYVMIDSITEKYELWKEVNEMLQKERENAENQITQKGKSFENQLTQFQNKLRANQYTQMQAENEQARLAKLQQELQDLEANLAMSLQEKSQKEMLALTDTIQTFMKSYAKNNDLDFILCKSSGIDNVLYANEIFDITDSVLKEMNKRYYARKAAETK
jgi:outer membrane protein